jgi:hypothetical protein
VMRRTLRELPDDVASSTRIEVEQRLVDEAARFDPCQLGKLAMRIRAHLDADGVLCSERDAAEKMELSFTQDVNGVIRVRGRLSAEGAAVLRSALSPLAKPVPKDVRSVAKRRADALVELARRVLAAGTLPVEGGVRPQVGLTVDIAELRRYAGVVDLDWGGTVSIQTARRICCDAEVIPIVMRGGSQPLDVGRRAAAGHRSAAPWVDRPGSGLCRARLRPPTRMVRCPPPRALGERRRDLDRQHRPRVRLPPHTSPPGRVDSPHDRRRAPPRPATMDRPPPASTMEHTASPEHERGRVIQVAIRRCDAANRSTRKPVACQGWLCALALLWVFREDLDVWQNPLTAMTVLSAWK